MDKEKTPKSKPVGIYSYFGYPLPFVERLDLIRQAGFGVTSLGLGEEEELVRSGKKDLMPGLARDRGLFVEYVHAPETKCNQLWSASAKDRSEAEKELSSSIAFCAAHSIPVLVVHITRGKGEQPAGPNLHGLHALEHVVQAALDSGVRIAIENTQRPEHLCYVFSRITHPCLGLCYDTSHDFLYSPEPGLCLREWGHLLLATHISDNDGLADRHWLPGEGIIDWGALGSVFPSGTYGGSLNLEIFPKDQGGETPLKFLKRAYERIRWLKGILHKGPDRP